MAGVLVHLNIRDVSTEVFLIVADGHIAVLIVGRHAESGSGHEIFRVARDEG